MLEGRTPAKERRLVKESEEEECRQLGGGSGGGQWKTMAVSWDQWSQITLIDRVGLGTGWGVGGLGLEPLALHLTVRTWQFTLHLWVLV